MARLARLASRRSVRADEGAFVVEGPNLVAEALSAGAVMDEVFVEQGPFSEEIERLIDRIDERGIPIYEVPAGTLRRVADVVTPQPILAVARIPPPSEPSAAVSDFLVVLAGVADPGNAGTLLRAAEAAGAGAVVFTKGSVDPYNPKCVRASAGAIFHLEVIVDAEAGETLEQLRLAGHQRVGAVVRGGVAYDQVDLTGPVTVVLGNESHGLPDDLVGAVDRPVSIPMAGRAESLNVAMTGAVLCFEVLRQRRAGKPL